MAKIPRKTYSIFANGATATDIEQFGAQTQVGIPNYTTDPNVIQSLAAWADGWSAAIISGNHAPYKQDMNAVQYVTSFGLCYLYQQGVPEWDSATNYFINSIVQNGGQMFVSRTDNNLNNVPPASSTNAFWTYLPFLNLANLITILGGAQPTRQVLNTPGSGTYTPTNPGVVRVVVRMVGAGGGGSSGGVGGNGGNTVFNGTVAGGGHGANTFQGGAGGVISGTAPSVGCTGSYGESPTRGNVGDGGGSGGSSAFGGNGGTISNTVNGTAGSNGSGGGGGMGGGYGQGGGGSGAYAEIVSALPLGSTAYTVGAGGAANGTAGAGGAGLIVIDEYYY